MEGERKFWIETFTGKKFDYEDITSNEIDIRDIAHALSNTCRFNGHCSRFYSVAEHSILVSSEIEKVFGIKAALPALLHDATEAYMPDVSKPLKHFWNTKFGIMDFEDGLQEHIFKQLKIGVSLDMMEEIKRYDVALLRAERDVLFQGRELWEFPENIPTIDPLVIGVNPKIIEMNFLERYSNLKIQINGRKEIQ